MVKESGRVVDVYENVTEGLKNIYRQRLQLLEKRNIYQYVILGLDTALRGALAVFDIDESRIVR